MRTAGGLPDGEDGDRAEVLHESASTRVSRQVLAGRTVIRKEPLGPDAEGRLRHERAMLERVRGVEGVAQLLGSPRYPGSIGLADAGDTTLAELPRPLPVDVLPTVAVGLARAVAGMHRRGVMHRDITPVNVVVSGEGVPCLVDFALATGFGEIRPEFGHHSEIVGTLEHLGADRAHRPVGGPARRPVRPGRDAVRAGHRCSAVPHRRPAASPTRPPRAGTDAAGRGEPGRPGGAVRSHRPAAREGARQPLPRPPTVSPTTSRCSPTRSGAGRPGRS